MTVDELRTYYQVRTDKALCPLLGVSASTISKWRKAGIPKQRQALIEVNTDGEIKADKGIKALERDNNSTKKE